MDASQFALWLQGFAELNAAPPTQEQWQSIREHLQLVFKKVTPEFKAQKIDVTTNDEVRKLLDEARAKFFYQPPNTIDVIGGKPYVMTC